MLHLRSCQKVAIHHLRPSAAASRCGLIARRLVSTRDFKVTLDGETLYIDKKLAEALGWKPGLSLEGLPLRLSGWEPHYFAITRPGTDADLLARGAIESSRNPRVQQGCEGQGRDDGYPFSSLLVT